MSTGLAASWTWDAACLSGLLEVCERDAFTSMWMNTLSMRRIAVPRDSRLGRRVANTLERVGAHVAFVELTNDLQVPVVMAVLRHGCLGNPVLTVGAAASLSMEIACLKALAEAVNGYEMVSTQFDGSRMAVPLAQDFSGIVDFKSHGLAYARPDMQRALEFMTASGEERPLEETCGGPPPSPSTQLAEVLSRVKRRCGEVVAVDLTTREFQEAGVFVAKLIVPDAVPLHPEHDWPFLAHIRLFQVPRLLGYRSVDSTVESLNRDPHPFA
jgi:ribosomal protein S12 methylthiotransferase accessory factor